MIQLLDVLAETCSASPESTCCVVGDSDQEKQSFLSYSSVWRCIERHEVWLKEVTDNLLSKTPQTDLVVVYLSSNSVDLLLSLLASTALNKSTTALLNIRWTANEMSSALKSKNKDSTTIILYGPNFESTGSQVASQLGQQCYSLPLPTFSSNFLQNNSDLSSDNNLQKVVSITRKDASKRINTMTISGSTDDALIIFTSGTTGGSKGVRLSHRAIAIQSLAKSLHPCEYSTETTMLASTVPLFHVGGLSSCLSVMFSGGKLIFPDSKSRYGFDVNVVRSSLLNLHTPVNTLVVVPAMLVSILGDDKAPKTQEEIMDWMMKYLEGTQPELTARGFIMQDMYECGGFDNWIDLNPAVIIDSFYEITSEVSEELMNDLQTAINQEDDLDLLGIDQSMRVNLKGLIA